LASPRRSEAKIYKKLVNPIILLLLFAVVFLSHVTWLGLHDVYFCGDGFTHYWNSVTRMNYLKYGNLTRFFLPNDGLHLFYLYPPLIYQITGVFLFFLGQSHKTAVLINSFFILLLIISVYLTGKELWNPQVGILSALVSASIPIIQNVIRGNLLDAQLCAMVALGCYLLIKSKNFTNTGYSIAFFFVMALGSLIKWTATFYVSGLFIICLWIMIAKMDNTQKKQFFLTGAGLAASLIIPIMARYYYFTREQQAYGFGSYFSGISLLLVFIAFLRLHKKLDKQIRDFYTGASLFFLTCAHFYYLKFWDLLYCYPEVASRGASREVDSIFMSWHSFKFFLDYNWLIFAITGLLFYIFSKNKTWERTYFLASIPVGMIFFIYHPDRDVRLVMPMIVFFAPLMTFWICQVSNKAVKYGAFAFLMLQVIISLVGWTIPQDSKIYSLLYKKYNFLKVQEFTGKLPTTLSTAQKKDMDFLANYLTDTSRNGPYFLVISYPEKYSDKNHPYKKSWFWDEKTLGYSGTDIAFKLFDKKNLYPFF